MVDVPLCLWESLANVFAEKEINLPPISDTNPLGTIIYHLLCIGTDSLIQKKWKHYIDAEPIQYDITRYDKVMANQYLHINVTNHLERIQQLLNTPS